MGLKDIVLHMPDVAAATSLLNAAVPLARRHDSHLIGINIYESTVPLAMVTDGYMDPATVARFAEEHKRAALENAAKVQAIFEERLRMEALSGEWRTVDGPISDTLCLHARYADLSMFSRPSGEDGDISLIEDVLFTSGRPILVVPQAFPCESIGERILIGWNATRESARAVGDALPLLGKAGMVRVLTISTSQDDTNTRELVAAEDIARHLARHGVKVTAGVATAGMLGPYDILLNEMSDVDADLLVIGGYGHGRMREMLLGGVTRDMIRHGTGPVMLSH